MTIYILAALVVGLITYIFVLIAKYHAQIKINDDLHVQNTIKEAEVTRWKAENQKLLEDIYNLQQKLKTQPDSEKSEETKPKTRKTSKKKEEKK